MFLTIHDKNIWYEVSGKGKALVLIHGYLETSEIWKRFSEKLSREFMVITIDLPGHGRSESFGETHSMDQMAGILKEMLDIMGLTKIVLTGHSLGGYVTLAFLELYPEMLQGYCLFHSHPLSDFPQTIEKRKEEVSMILAGKKDLFYPDNIERMYAPQNLEKLAEDVRRSKAIAAGIPGSTMISVLNGMMNRPSRVKIMEEGRVPCLWILGKFDNYIPFDAMPQRVRLPQNAKVVLLNESGHLGFIEEENNSVRILSEFAESL